MLKAQALKEKLADAIRAHWRVAPEIRARLRHTATKSSAVTKNVVARSLEFIGRVMLKARPLKPPAEIEPAVKMIYSSSQPNQRGPLPVIKQVLAAAWRHDNRVLIAAPKLELAITKAVKEAVPGCESFVGVVVRRTNPKSRVDANWALRGVKFGMANRDQVNEAMATIVERMQREFRLSEE